MKFSFFKKNKYKSFFEKCDKMFCIINNDKFINVNDAFCNTLFYSKKELLSLKSFTSLIHPDDLYMTMGEIKKSNNYFINRYKTKDGNYKKINWGIVYSKNNIFATCLDMTDNYEILQNFKQNKLLADNEKFSLLGNWELNINTNNLIVSDGLKKIYEIDTNTMSYNKYIAFNHKDEQDIIESSINKCKLEKDSYELVHKILINNKIKYIFVKGVFVEPNSIIGISQDISKQKFIEFDLIKAKQAAEKASQMKTAFVANISHEIRTPINGIICMSGLLKGTKLDEEQTEFLNTMIHSSGVLLSIINNVLDFSKIEAGKIELDYIESNLQEIITKVNNLFEPMIKQKNLTLKIYIDNNVPKNIVTDPIKLQQILSNLINNSIKFTEYGSIIIVIKLSGTLLKFEVKDTGIGISDENQQKLFKAFMQADSSTTRNFGGTGLGLLICKNLVELMNGEIGLLSNLGIGTTIWFNLPLNIDLNTKNLSDFNTNLSTFNSKANLNTFNSNVNLNTFNENTDPLIIIIEDNHVNQFVVKKMMEKIGYTNLVIYKNGKIALDNLLEFKLNNIKPALILMDLHLPIMDGYTCTKKIRDNEILTPIIALTANAMSGEKEKCINIGMNDFILKPIDLEELKNKTTEWII